MVGGHRRWLAYLFQMGTMLKPPCSRSGGILCHMAGVSSPSQQNPCIGCAEIAKSCLTYRRKLLARGCPITTGSVGGSAVLRPHPRSLPRFLAWGNKGQRRLTPGGATVLQEPWQVKLDLCGEAASFSDQLYGVRTDGAVRISVSLSE